MFNKNYLGHNFSERFSEFDFYFKCSKCLILIYFEKTYVFCDGAGMRLSDQTLTCDEVIIKKLLE